ncbi:hypothetical protein, partial [Candidatus Pelagibacter communis]|uniref:hypothetical protein n=1 Tax=Pelagibacter ubique TaxID=198252 RepID=UPI000A746DE3
EAKLLPFPVKSSSLSALDTVEYLVKEFGHNPIREEKAEEIIEKIKEVKAENLKSIWEAFL